MKFTIEINCDNAAFRDGEMNGKLSSILADLAERVADESKPYTGVLRDSNGNWIGRAWMTED